MALSLIKKGYTLIRGLKFRFYGSSGFPKLKGKCRISNRGLLKIGKNFSVSGIQIPVFITVENKYSDLTIGDNVFINYGVDIGCTKKIQIGDNVKIGQLTNIIDSNYHQTDSVDRNLPKEIIKGCTILPGVRIGDNSVVAAGSIVTKDIEKDTLVAGVPAKVIRKLKINDGWIRK
ncbi:acyltransferase [Heyndrickxia coagulans]|uniref:acyltransferase n=1 Tax=Heyndrickxia coagulans TaxID=1398 RepID=UPI000E4F772B|nr:acyltransferase [Heyndrickxia coagulans]RGR83292.1 acyltransferase [Heyndrickxia coagulans]